MTKNEAIKAIESGKKVRHYSFTENEWVRKAKYRVARYEFEDGNICLRSEFWDCRKDIHFNRGWEVV